MKDFVGLENVSEEIKQAILNFSFFLTVGNMDEAYNSVRNIKNNTVWQNMA
jgi:intraflagellar transport protein 140